MAQRISRDRHGCISLVKPKVWQAGQRTREDGKGVFNNVLHAADNVADSANVVENFRHSVTYS
jgi:hypothetical protein